MVGNEAINGAVMTLMIFRSTATPGSYTVVGESPLETLAPGVLNTFVLSTPIPVLGGDRIGLWADLNAACTTGEGTTVNATPSAVAPPVGANVTEAIFPIDGSPNISATLTPALPQSTFASMHAEATLLLPRGAANDLCWLLASFKLGDTSDGIDPLTEAVTVEIGELSLTLAPGSFTKSWPGWSYKGSVDGGRWHVAIQRWFGGIYLLNAVCTRLDLEPPADTIDIHVGIGDDTGTRTITPHVLQR
jgi:hypothetical protein